MPSSVHPGSLTTVSIPEYHLNKWMLMVLQVPQHLANRLCQLTASELKSLSPTQKSDVDTLNSIVEQNNRALKAYYGAKPERSSLDPFL